MSIYRRRRWLTWMRAGSGLDEATVYSLAWTGDRLLAGLEGGLAVGEGSGHWVRSGPPVRARAVGAGLQAWMAGASPGGLWFTEDGGRAWRRTGSFVSVRTIVAREG